MDAPWIDKKNTLYGFPLPLIRKRLEESSPYFRGLPEDRKQALLNEVKKNPQKGLQVLKKIAGVKSNDLLIPYVYHGKEYLEHKIPEEIRHEWKGGVEGRFLQMELPIAEAAAELVIAPELLARKPIWAITKTALEGLKDAGLIEASEIGDEALAASGHPIAGLLVGLFGHALGTSVIRKAGSDISKAYKIGKIAKEIAGVKAPAAVAGTHKTFAYLRRLWRSLKEAKKIAKGAKDLSEVDRLLTNVEYISTKHPEAKPFLDREIARMFGRHEDSFRILHAGGKGVIDAFGRSTLPGLDKNEKQILAQVIKLGDIYSRFNKKVILPDGTVSWRIPEEQLRAWNVSDRVIDAYNRIRNVVDTSGHYLAAFIGKHYKTLGMSRDEAGQAIKRILFGNKGYFPRQRPESAGKYWIVAKDKVNGKALWREPARAWELEGKKQKILEALIGKDKALNPTGFRTRAQNIDFVVEPVREWPEGAPFERVTATSNVGALLDSLVQKGKIDEASAQAFREGLGELFASRGFGRHLLHRSPYWIGGYEDDVLKVLPRYVGGLTGYTHKVMAAKDYADLLSKFDALKKPKLFRFLNDYTRRILENTTKTDRAFAGLRQLAYGYYLAGKPAFAVLNATQNIITANPYLKVLGKRLGVEKGIQGGLLKAMKDTAQALIKKDVKHLAPDEAKAFMLALRRKVIDDPFVEEMLAAETGAAQMGREVGKILSLPISSSEYLNRGSTFLSAFRLARKAGKSFDEAWNIAADAVNKTQFLYGKANLPLWASTPLGKTWLTLRQYTLHLLSLWKQLLDEKEYKALLESIAMVGTLGGLSAYPFVKAIKHHLRKDYGIDVDSELKKAGLSDKAIMVINRGLPVAVGIDLSPSLQIDIPFSNVESAKDMLNELLGATGSTILNMATGLKDIVAGAETKDPYRIAMGAEKISPAVVRNVIKAVRLHDYGARTRTGVPRYYYGEQGPVPFKYTEKEALLRSLGFVPTRESQMWENERRYRDMREYSRKKRELIYETLRAGEVDKAVREIVAYNEWAMKYGFRPINVKALRAALKQIGLDRRKMVYPY